jgi:hypothetical protein
VFTAAPRFKVLVPNFVCSSLVEVGLVLESSVLRLEFS